MKIFLIKIPPENQKKAEAFAELLENLHETFAGRRAAFEIVTEAQHTSFRFACDEQDSTLLLGQIYAIFPDSEIEEVADIMETIFNRESSKSSFQTPLNLPSHRGEQVSAGKVFIGEVSLKKTDLFPIKTYREFSGDSLSGLLAVLTKATPQEKSVLQIVFSPRVDSSFLHIGRGIRRKLESIRHIFRLKYWFKKGNHLKAFHEAFAQKESERLFSVSIRFAVCDVEKSRYSSVVNALSQFSTVDLNAIRVHEIKDMDRLKNRLLKSPFLLSKSEFSTVYHLPNEKEVPNLVYTLSRKSDPPASLPTDFNNTDISFFGETNFHNSHVPFGMLRNDRRRHLYAVGKSGVGKSKLLELLILNDIRNGKGVGVLDPHGDLVDNVLKCIPQERIKDVVLFDPADEQFPIAFNPLEKVPSHLKMRVTIGFLEIFKKLFGTNWTERLEHVLRYTVLALLDSPNTTVLSILKMLSDKNYRQYIVRNIEDDVVKNFWVNEFAGWSEKFDAEAITPLLNKVGQFVATNMIRNIVGQPENKVDFRDIMDNGKILLMKVSKGMLGEENAGLLGAMAVTKIYQAAMSRADTPEEQRQDFYFYVDEFHNFATDTFDEILSEARKYRLNITLAHQFMGQLSERIRKTIFGNVGTLLSFRVGAEDAAVLAQEYDPIFSPKDIINLGVRDFYCKMSINGEISQAFSGRTLDMWFPQHQYVAECMDYSRNAYCHPVSEVERTISAWEEGSAVAAESKKNVSQETKKYDPFQQPEFEEPIL